MKPRLDPRLFLALPLSRTVRSRLSAVQDELRKFLEEWYFVKPVNFHVTLKFFGDVPETMIPKIHSACTDIVKRLSPFSLHWSNIDFFGPPEAGRVLFAAADESPELNYMAEFLTERFTGNEARKKFRPHITLAKTRKKLDRTVVRKNQNMLRRLREHGRIGPEKIDVDLSTFHREFVLMETVWVGRAVEYFPRERYMFGEETDAVTEAG